MFSSIKNHPFAVEAFFKSSTVFTFATPKDEIQHLIPECLELDLHDNHWAFIAVAMVQTEGLRPKGFPEFFGNDFFLIGYRVFVRFTTAAGKNLRGLYILKSETDKKKMEFFGNIFTHYNYSTTDIHQETKNGISKIYSNHSAFCVDFENAEAENISLPQNSPFTDWKQARRFAGPLPFTFTYSAGSKQVLIIEGVRENWKPLPIKVNSYSFSFIDQLKIQGIRLASAFIIRNIPYYWKKGKLESWQC
ncbi:MAG: DUF2071 domain-containing protein [Agriterribacter sp.]